MSKVERFLQDLLWDEAYKDIKGRVMNVLRLKGLIALSEPEKKTVIVQGVHDTYDTYETKAECEDCTVVVIGRFLQYEVLMRGLNSHLS